MRCQHLPRQTKFAGGATHGTRHARTGVVLGFLFGLGEGERLFAGDLLRGLLLRLGAGLLLLRRDVELLAVASFGIHSLVGPSPANPPDHLSTQV